MEERARPGQLLIPLRGGETHFALSSPMLQRPKAKFFSENMRITTVNLTLKDQGGVNLVSKLLKPGFQVVATEETVPVPHCQTESVHSLLIHKTSAMPGLRQLCLCTKVAPVWTR